MYKVKDISVPTDKRNLPLTEVQKPVPYTPSKEEEEKVGFVRSRYNRMNDKRRTIDTMWQVFQKQYEAMYAPYPDGRSASNVPLERSIIELFVAESLKRSTKFNIKPCVGYEKQAKVLDRVWKYDWRVNKRNNELLDNEYITATFGTSVIYTGFEQCSRIIEDFGGVSEDGKFSFDRKMETKARVILENFDIRNFWIDERAHKVEEAVDCIAIQYMTQQEYDNLKYNSLYRNTDKEVASYLYQSDEYIYRTYEERGDGESYYVKLTHYWNQALDKYMVIANDRVIIREHPIMNATHSLPFVVRQYGRNVGSIYGYGLCQALMMFKSEINTLREMLMDAIKRSNQSAIAIGNGLVFDGNSLAYDNTIYRFKGNLAGNFQQISGTPPNQAIFNYLVQLYKDVAIFCGIDIQNILGEPQQTAYQTAVQKESSLSRVNVVLKNRDVAYERLADLHKDNLQMFYPLKLVRQAVPLDANDKAKEVVKPTYPEIELEGEEMKGGNFVKSDKNSIFEVKPQEIRGNVKVDVYTDLNAPTVNEVEKAQKMEFFNTVGNITAAYQANPELESIMPMKRTIRDIAESLNIEVETAEAEDVKQAQNSLFEEIRNLMPQPAPAAEGEPMPAVPAGPLGNAPAAQVTAI